MLEKLFIFEEALTKVGPEGKREENQTHDLKDKRMFKQKSKLKKQVNQILAKIQMSFATDHLDADA